MPHGEAMPPPHRFLSDKTGPAIGKHHPPSRIRPFSANSRLTLRSPGRTLIKGQLERSSEASVPFKKKLLMATIVCCLLALSLTAGLLVLNRLEQRERQYCYGIARAQLVCLERQLESAFNAVRILAERCVLPDGGVTAFTRTARDLMIPDTIRSLQLAPDGQIIYDYPPTSYGGPFPDLFTDPVQRTGAIRCRESGQPEMTGPIPLRQGGQGLIYRLPVYRGKAGQTFWGFAIVVLNLERQQEQLNDAFTLADLHYALYRRDTNTDMAVHLAGYPRETLDRPLEISTIMPDGDWFLAVEPSAGWMPVWQAAGLLGLCLLMGILIAMPICRVLGCLPHIFSPAMPENRDPLTRNRNKSALLEDLDAWIASREKFCLISLSLTSFAALSEQYGYDTGERLLLAMSQRLHALMPRSARLYRTDTNAFALLLDRETTGSLLKTLNLQFSRPLLTGSRQMPCQPALGIAQFPLDGHIPAILLAKAEERREYDTREQHVDWTTL